MAASYEPLKAVASIGERTTLKVEEVMPQKSVDAISSVFGAGPRGCFVKGTLGTTHYTLESPKASSADAPRELVVRMAHRDVPISAERARAAHAVPEPNLACLCWAGMHPRPWDKPRRLR